MLIQKGGICRNIEEKRLQEYKEKGYAVMQETVKEKPIEKMTVDELKAFAEQNSIDIAAAKNKADMLEIILARLKPLEDEPDEREPSEQE